MERISWLPLNSSSRGNYKPTAAMVKKQAKAELEDNICRYRAVVICIPCYCNFLKKEILRENDYWKEKNPNLYILQFVALNAKLIE